MAIMKLYSFAAMLMLMLMVQFRSSPAAILDVGGASGWRVGVNYTAWAANHTVHPGDTLFFMYPKGNHTVVQVSKTDYDNCNTSPTNALFNDHSQGNTSVRVNVEGEHYFICTVPHHCVLGMKLGVDVVAPSPSPSPSSSPPSSAPSPSSPSPSSSSSPLTSSPSPSSSSSPLTSPPSPSAETPAGNNNSGSQAAPPPVGQNTSTAVRMAISTKAVSMCIVAAILIFA